MPVIACDIIAEIEGAVRGGSPARRVQILRQVAGLFISNAARLTGRQIDVFDEILVCLLDQVDARSLAHLSIMLAAVPSAPREVVRRLARHEDATVAAPALRSSNCLSEADLVEIASGHSHQHMFAIANRRSLGEALTDALLTCADENVCRALAGNPGARFSEPGYAALAACAERDDDIADSLVIRTDTPATVLGELLARVTKPVRTRLAALAPPQTRGAMQQAIQRIEAEENGKPRAPIDYSEAKSIVLALNNDGKLSDSAVNRFAVRQEHRNLIAALSLLATVEIEVIEPFLDQHDGIGLMIACRASRLNIAGTRSKPFPFLSRSGPSVSDRSATSQPNSVRPEARLLAGEPMHELGRSKIGPRLLGTPP
jgi:uncharacterized protein (DUF2336 family)